VSNMVEEISDTIIKKIKEVVKDENEQRMIIELLQKTSTYSKQTRAPTIKKEFQLLVDQYFPYKEKD